MLAQDLEKGEEFTATFDLSAYSAAQLDDEARQKVYEVERRCLFPVLSCVC